MLSKSPLLQIDELADGRLNGICLEAHHEPDFECLCESFERCDASSMLAGFDARDRRMASAHALGELLLGEPELGGANDGRSNAGRCCLASFAERLDPLCSVPGGSRLASTSVVDYA